MTQENQEDLQVVSGKEVESNDTLTFYPPVYIQRYFAIKDILAEEKWCNQISKVVEFGCADLKLFKYIKPLEHIEHICAVDIDETLMERCRYEAKPMTFEYVTGLSRSLIIDLYVGDIAEPDSRLFDVDAVICIELIEHLHQETLDKVPATVFEYLQPKLAIFTTPNSEFNVLFNLEGFRHDDHKFEWTRKEFENWCHSILEIYVDYDVYFEGIGKGPEGTESLGCVSQMAVFYRKNDTTKRSDSKNVIAEPYRLYERIVYPYKKDERSEEEKFTHELAYRINNVQMNKMYSHYQREDSKYEIPTEYLWHYTKDWCSTEDLLLDRLKEKGYTICKSEAGEHVIVVDEIESDLESEYSDDYYEDVSENTTTTVCTNESWE